jgi:neutral ceramidase
MTLLAGAAAVDISPRHPMALFGYPHVERVSTGVHDPLLASALYLRQGEGVALLISLDLLMLDAPVARAMRERVAEHLAIPPERIWIACTHTHSGPVSGRIMAWSDDPAVPAPGTGYLDSVAEQVVEAAGQAVRGSILAEAAWTSAVAQGVGGNRRAADGETDPEVGIFVVRRSGGGPLLGLATIYGMHPTVLHEDSTLVSADFPGFARRHLRERWGTDLPVLYLMGPSGDQSPRRFVSGQTFGEAERLGRLLGSTVHDAVARLDREDFRRDWEIRGTTRAVDLPRRPVPSLADAERTLSEYRHRFEELRRSDPNARAAIRTAECAVFGAEGSVRLASLDQRGRLDEAVRACLPAEVFAMKLGPASIVGLPGELFSSYAKQIKRGAPQKAFVVTQVQGHLQGYLVTEEAEQSGGYEALTALFDGPRAARALVDTALSLLREMA